MEEPVSFNPEHTPEDLIEAIDRKYEELKGKEDRVSLKWGHFSRGMNMEIRNYLVELPEHSQIRERYLYVQLYWTARSRLLDLHKGHKLLSRGRIKRETKLAKDLRSMILTGKFLKPVSQDEQIASFLKRA